MAGIAIVVPSYNDRVFLARLVESLWTERAGAPWTLVIVDDHSTDDTPDWVMSNLNGYATYLRPEEKSFFSRCVNHGISFALEELHDFDFILALNSDIEVTDYWAADMIATALKNRAGVVGATLHYPTGHIQHLGAYGAGQHYDINRMQVRHFDGLQVAWVTGAALMAHQEVFRRVGLFPILKNRPPQQYDASDRQFCANAINGGYDIWVSGALMYHDTLTAEKIRREGGQYGMPGMQRVDRI